MASRGFFFLVTPIERRFFVLHCLNPKRSHIAGAPEIGYWDNRSIFFPIEGNFLNPFHHLPCATFFICILLYFVILLLQFSVDTEIIAIPMSMPNNYGLRRVETLDQFLFRLRAWSAPVMVCDQFSSRLMLWFQFQFVTFIALLDWHPPYFYSTPALLYNYKSGSGPVLTKTFKHHTLYPVGRTL